MTSRSNGDWPFDPLHPERDPRGAERGERRKNWELDRVEAGASPDFIAAAERAVLYVARRRRRLTTDPIWTVLAFWKVPPPKEPRVMGPIMKNAVSWGWLESASETSRSVRPACNRRPLLVYVSLIYTESNGKH
jgi:hypothetical protein